MKRPIAFTLAILFAAAAFAAGISFQQRREQLGRYQFLLREEGGMWCGDTTNGQLFALGHENNRQYVWRPLVVPAVFSDRRATP
jgi:hypothetical protein